MTPDPDAPLTPGASCVLYSVGHAKPVDLGSGGFARLAPETAHHRHRTSFDRRALTRAESAYKRAIAESRPVAPEVWRSDWLDLRPPKRAWAEAREEIRAALPRIARHRERLNGIYRDAIPAEARLGSEYDGWRFQILAPEPDALIEELFAAGLFASRHYASLGRGVFAEGELSRPPNVCTAGSSTCSTTGTTTRIRPGRRPGWWPPTWSATRAAGGRGGKVDEKTPSGEGVSGCCLALGPDRRQ